MHWRLASSSSRQCVRHLFSRAVPVGRAAPKLRTPTALLLGLGVGLYCSRKAWAVYSRDADSSHDTSASPDVTYYTMDEVAQHNTPDDMWMVIDGEVYDVTSWLSSHPGGSGVLCAFAGRDVSREYVQLKHSCDASAIRAGLHIGTVKGYQPPSGLPHDLCCPASHSAAERSNRKRLVILGAGICGVSAAYHLMQDAGIRESYDVTVMDRNWMVGGTALKSSAIMFAGPLLEQRKENKEAVGLAAWLGQMSYEMAARIQNEWEDIKFMPRPMLGLCFSDAQAQMAKRTLAPNDRFVPRDEAMELEPLLQGNSSLVGALLKSGCFTVDPFMVCNAFAKRAAQAGAKFRMGCDIVSIRRPAERQEGRPASFELVTSDSEVIEADALLLCAGAADASLAEQVGHKVRVRPMHGQMYAVRLPAEVPKLNHMVFSYEGPLYWKQRGDGANSTLDPQTLERRCHHIYGLEVAGSDGVCKFGGDRVEGDHREEVYAEKLLETKGRVEEIFPLLQGSQMIGRGWGGTMPFTPDQNIIVGEVEPQFFVCTGAPFTKGAAAGLLLAVDVAGKIANGGKSLIADSGVAPQQLAEYISQCRPQRFAKLEA